METASTTMTARAIFAANVRRLRRVRGLSQERLAESAGLHPNYVGSVERGERNISVDNMEAIARALGVALASMLLIETE